MDTIAAIATSAAQAALGVLRLSGPDARQAALGMLDLPAEKLEPRRACFARALDDGRQLDQVVAVYFPGPGSATGEDLVEITAHGSPFVMRRLLEAALSRGCRLARPGEFTQRGFLSGRLDLSQAEAVGALIRARTDAAHRAAVLQLEGGLSRAVAGLKAPILELLAQVEVRLDHPEEDIPGIPDGEAAKALAGCREAIGALAATFERGRLMAEGARVCLLGRPNAGKSSLLNALLGRERAIVSDAPGTTRDTLEEAADFEGLEAVLIDTAGLRRGAADRVEALGIERTRQALERSDLAVLVVDGSRPEDEEDGLVHDEVRRQAGSLGLPVVEVLSKADLAARARAPGVRVSALKGQGLRELVTEIRRRLEHEGQPRERLAITSARHKEALSAAASELGLAQEAVSEHPGRWEDRVACHLREALARLGEILGEGAPDEVLAEIFSRFCVGK